MADRNQALLDEWVRSGIVTLPTEPKGPLPEPPLRMPDGTAKALLDADRDETRFPI
jgi:hypothetical protein